MHFNKQSASSDYKQFHIRVNDTRAIEKGGAIFSSESYGQYINDINLTNVVKMTSSFTVKPYIHTPTAGETYKVTFYYVKLRDI